MGYDSMNQFAHFAEVVEDNSIRPILRMYIGENNPSRFIKTITSDLTGLRALLNVPYVTKSPPLYAYQITVTVEKKHLPSLKFLNYPDPSGTLLVEMICRAASDLKFILGTYFWHKNSYKKLDPNTGQGWILIQTSWNHWAFQRVPKGDNDEHIFEIRIGGVPGKSQSEFLTVL